MLKPHSFKIISLFLLAFFIPMSAYAFDAPERVGIITQFLFGASTVSQQALPPNSNRAFLYIQNQSGASTLTISFFGASTLGIQLSGGSSFNSPVPIGSSTYLQSSAGVINALVLEGIH